MYLKNGLDSQDYKKIFNHFNDKSVICFLIAEKSNISIDSLIKYANENNRKIIGGIFPGVCSKDGYSETDIIIKEFSEAHKSILVKNLSKGNFESLKELNKENKGNTAIILLDGLTQNISKFLSDLYSIFGNKINYIGGGAGRMTLQSSPCIFNNEGIFKDAAVVSFINEGTNLGVKHGWMSIAGPFVSTKSDKNVLQELNWETAFSVYKQFIEKDSGKKITSENFFDIAKGYPFGMHRENEEFVVRDPISVQNESDLFCVGEISEHSVLDILKGVPESLYDAAKKSTQEALSIINKTPDQFLLIDCISRVLFLEQDFKKELNAVQKVIDESKLNIPLEGIISLGEISSFGDGYIEFFNKTIVSSIFTK